MIMTNLRGSAPTHRRGAAWTIVSMCLLVGLTSGTGLAGLATTAAQNATPAASPTATADPERIAMLDYDESAPLNLHEIGVEERDGAIVRDVTFDSPGAVVAAYIVEPAAVDATPAAAPDRAGIVFFHWLETGSPTSNRTEFLPDAVTLAQEGVVSVLVQGDFPWLKDPANLEADQAAVVTEALKVRRGIDLLLARGDVDPARIAVVGHDYGAMYAILLAGVDPRPKAFVLMAATPHHADWNVPFWLAPGGLDEAGQAAYMAGMAPLDPISAVADAAPAALLFQFAREDVYIPESTALEFYTAASEPKRLELFDAEHPLNDEATASRMVWLRGQLGL